MTVHTLIDQTTKMFQTKQSYFLIPYFCSFVCFGNYTVPSGNFPMGNGKPARTKSCYHSLISPQRCVALPETVLVTQTTLFLFCFVFLSVHCCILVEIKMANTLLNMHNTKHFFFFFTRISFPTFRPWMPLRLRESTERLALDCFHQWCLSVRLGYVVGEGGEKRERDKRT